MGVFVTGFVALGLIVVLAVTGGLALVCKTFTGVFFGATAGLTVTDFGLVMDGLEAMVIVFLKKQTMHTVYTIYLKIKQIMV